MPDISGQMRQPSLRGVWVHSQVPHRATMLPCWCIASGLSELEAEQQYPPSTMQMAGAALLPAPAAPRPPGHLQPDADALVDDGGGGTTAAPSASAPAESDAQLVQQGAPGWQLGFTLQQEQQLQHGPQRMVRFCANTTASRRYLMASSGHVLVARGKAGQLQGNGQLQPEGSGGDYEGSCSIRFADEWLAKLATAPEVVRLLRCLFSKLVTQ